MRQSFVFLKFSFFNICNISQNFRSRNSSPWHTWQKKKLTYNQCWNLSSLWCTRRACVDLLRWSFHKYMFRLSVAVFSSHAVLRTWKFRYSSTGPIGFPCSASRPLLFREPVAKANRVDKFNVRDWISGLERLLLPSRDLYGFTWSILAAMRSSHTLSSDTIRTWSESSRIEDFREHEGSAYVCLPRLPSWSYLPGICKF